MHLPIERKDKTTTTKNVSCELQQNYMNNFKYVPIGINTSYFMVTEN